MKWLSFAIVALLVMLLSGVGLIQTRIGSPAFYWSHGIWPLLGFTVIALAGIGLLIEVLELCSDQRKPNWEGTTASLLILIVVLQILPEPDSGLRIVPTAPWAFSNFIARLTAALVWIVLVGVSIAFSFSKPTATNWGCRWLLVAVAINGLLSNASTAKTQQSELIENKRLNERSNTQSQATGIDKQLHAWKNHSTSIRNELQDLHRQQQTLKSELYRLPSTDSHRTRRDALEEELEELQLIAEQRRERLLQVEEKTTLLASKWRRLRRMKKEVNAGKKTGDDTTLLHALDEQLRKLQLQRWRSIE